MEDTAGGCQDAVLLAAEGARCLDHAPRSTYKRCLLHSDPSHTHSNVPLQLVQTAGGCHRLPKVHHQPTAVQGLR